MKVEIDEYRGWIISFDTERELFYAYSDSYDTDKDRKTFSSMKSFIDEFIKENQEFKPVWVERPASTYSGYHKIKLIGIRKDKRFIYEDENGKRAQLSEYDESNYILCDERNKEIYKKYEENEKKFRELIDVRKKLDNMIFRTGLDTIKSQY